MIDRTASAVNLARSMLSTLDRSRLETPVQTETLRMLLETIVDLGTPAQTRKVGDAATREVMGRVAKVT